MKKLTKFLLMLCCLAAVEACGKPAEEKGVDERPMFGLWSDPGMNYMLSISSDSISFFFDDDMNGRNFSVPFQKVDVNNITFDCMEGAHGSVALNPEIKSLTLKINGDGIDDIFEIPANHKLNLVTTAPTIAKTFLLDEGHSTPVDTLTRQRFLPWSDIKDGYVAVDLPEGKKGWIRATEVLFTRGSITPDFLDREYASEYQNLMGHPDRIETYSFKDMGGGKIGMMRSLRYYDGRPAQETYYLGNLDGIYLKVTDRFDSYDDWENSNVNGANPLDQSFDVTMIDCLGLPEIRMDKKSFTQVPV